MQLSYTEQPSSQDNELNQPLSNSIRSCNLHCENYKLTSCISAYSGENTVSFLLFIMCTMVIGYLQIPNCRSVMKQDLIVQCCYHFEKYITLKATYFRSGLNYISFFYQGRVSIIFHSSFKPLELPRSHLGCIIIGKGQIPKTNLTYTSIHLDSLRQYVLR